MTLIFFLQLLLSFCIGGLFVGGATLAAEHFGPAVGGVLAGLPSTVAISLLFIALTSSVEDVVAATMILPIVLSLSGLFLAVWTLCSSLGILRAHAIALGCWFALASYARFHPPSDFRLSLCLFAIVVAGSYLLIRSLLPAEESATSPLQFSFKQLSLRAGFAGAIIASAVALNRLGGPYLGGMMAGFPASFLSTLSIASLSKGRAFALSLLRPMFLSGMLSCLVYIVSVRSSYPTLGVLTGTLFAYGLAGLTGWFIYRARAFRGGHWDGEGSEGS